MSICCVARNRSFDQTDYPDFELLIIDTGSRDPPRGPRLPCRGSSPYSLTVCGCTLPGPFTYARAMNRHAQAQGDLCCQLDNDIAFRRRTGCAK